MTQHLHFWVIFPRKKFIQRNICTPLFITALSTTAKSKNQHKCPTTNELIMNMCYTYTVDYSNIVVSSYAIVQFVATWMGLENMLSGLSQKNKDK